MLAPQLGVPFDNKLLSLLPRADFDLLAPYFNSRQLAQGATLQEAADEADHVYFPHSGMLSLLVVMKDGNAIETAMVGREGVVGAMTGLGLYRSQVRVVVQLAMGASTISASHFRKVVAQSSSIRDLCLHYNETLLKQARVTAACNALHSVEARFCRWLLQSRDRAESDTIALTQEFLSGMLGVRRTSVTDAASHMQKLGAISYSRGVIQIIDPTMLRRTSCECYETLSDDPVH